MKIPGLKVIGVGIVVLAVCVFLINRAPLEKYRESNEMGGEAVTIDVCLDRGADTKKVARVLDDVWQRLHDISRRMNGAIEDSDVAKINRSYAAPQKVGADTIKVLKDAIKYKKLTHGVFDITASSLVNLWRKCQKEDRLPTAEELKIAKDAVGLEHVKFLADNKVQVTNKNTTLDYGGSADAYAIDEAVRMLRKRGYHNFLIDAGGDMFASGLNCERKPWKIAIKNPEDITKIMDVISISNAAVSTSGNYKHFYLIKGQRFSHMINPLTGYPQKGVVSATVIAPTAFKNDALAASLCLLDPAQGEVLIDSLGKSYAGMVITKSQSGRLTINKTKNYKNFQVRKALR